MQKAGIVPKHQVLDNQASAAYKKAIGNSDMTYELVPPDDHQCNMVKKAIQTFKDHFVGVLSGCAPIFPMHLWCKLLPQVERQLLLLQQSRLHPNLSAYAHVYGHHDYNKHPFIPIKMEPLYMINHTNVESTQNTAKRRLSSACPPNTIRAGNSGQLQPKPLESQVPRFSSTNT